MKYRGILWYQNYPYLLVHVFFQFWGMCFAHFVLVLAYFFRNSNETFYFCRLFTKQNEAAC